MQIVMQKIVIYVILSLWEAGIKAWEASKLKRPKEKQNWIEGTAFCLMIKKWSLRKMNLLKLGRKYSFQQLVANNAHVLLYVCVNRSLGA